MIPDRTDAARDLLAFYSEFGVDAVLNEEPTDRFATAETLVITRKATAAKADFDVGNARHVTAPPAPDEATMAARAAATHVATLDELRAVLDKFEGCGLKATATQLVFADGNPQARLMFVGEAPGRDEDIEGLPFVGRSGKLLDRMLAAAGLEGRVLITNTVFWRPPGNRTPTPHEQLICAPFLERVIALTKPRILLLVGGASAKSVLKTDEGILSLRGKWREWRSADGELAVPALPTLHPAFLLRQPAAKKRAWSDLLTLAERLDRPQGPA